MASPAASMWFRLEALPEDFLESKLHYMEWLPCNHPATLFLADGEDIWAAPAVVRSAKRYKFVRLKVLGSDAEAGHRAVAWDLKPTGRFQRVDTSDESASAASEGSIFFHLREMSSEDEDEGDPADDQVSMDTDIGGHAPSLQDSEPEQDQDHDQVVRAQDEQEGEEEKQRWSEISLSDPDPLEVFDAGEAKDQAQVNCAKQPSDTESSFSGSDSEPRSDIDEAQIEDNQTKEKETIDNGWEPEPPQERVERLYRINRINRSLQLVPNAFVWNKDRILRPYVDSPHSVEVPGNLVAKPKMKVCISCGASRLSYSDDLCRSCRRRVQHEAERQREEQREAWREEAKGEAAKEEAAKGETARQEHVKQEKADQEKAQQEDNDHGHHLLQLQSWKGFTLYKSSDLEFRRGRIHERKQETEASAGRRRSPIRDSKEPGTKPDKFKPFPSLGTADHEERPSRVPSRGRARSRHRRRRKASTESAAATKAKSGGDEAEPKEGADKMRETGVDVVRYGGGFPGYVSSQTRATLNEMNYLLDFARYNGATPRERMPVVQATYRYYREP